MTTLERKTTPMNLVTLTGDASTLAQVLLAIRDHLTVTSVAYITDRDHSGQQTICVEIQ